MRSNEKILPAPDTLNQLEYGKFVLANLAAKRAKQIKDGAPPLVRIDSNHALSIALAEIAAGKIKPRMDADGHASVEMPDEHTPLDTLDLHDPALLLPAIDEELAEEFGLSVFGDDDDDLEDMDAGEGESLADLLDEEPDATSSDDTEISLDDLAEQEEAGEIDDSDENL
ncbi:MAG: DNA-directed RNA polymerase subunit omega [Fimbriimonadaceae bacterium]|jgi:DNA-directed RNA polymerase subunit omega|nr:DNA-directed RNA polymerase subunit omega [Fimbriimonadaceae bacterium]